MHWRVVQEEYARALVCLQEPLQMVQLSGSQPTGITAIDMRVQADQAPAAQLDMRVHMGMSQLLFCRGSVVVVADQGKHGLLQAGQLLVEADLASFALVIDQLAG